MVCCGMDNCLILHYSYPISQFLDNEVWTPTEEDWGEGGGCVYDKTPESQKSGIRNATINLNPVHSH